MIDSLYNGISGLSIYQKALNSESNNIANVNTIAFKSDNISFADMIYQDGYGKGAKVSNIAKNFEQGNMKLTANNYDMAIIGDGYFTVKDGDSTFYTRAGNFRMGSNGTLQMPNGLEIQGLSANVPTVTGTNLNSSIFGSLHTNFLASQSVYSDTQIQTINTKATNYQSSAKDSGISGAGYKTASAKVADIEALGAQYRTQLDLYASDTVTGTPSVAQETQTVFNMADINDAYDSISIYVDGSKYVQDYEVDAVTTLNKLSDQISNITGVISSVDSLTGVLTTTSLIPGEDIKVSDAKINNDSMTTTVTVDEVKGTGLLAVTSLRDALKNAVEVAGGEFLEIINTLDLSTQDAAELTSIQLKLDSLQISDNSFGDMIVDNGTIYIKQGDNQFLVGKVPTFVFNDNLSLSAQGDNLYAKTTLSGEPIFAGDINTIQNKTLELSNSDLSEGLVNLMVYQRSFEANSKSITTSDDLLKTAIQLKK
jgi:flagellar hook protein FlgE